MIRHHHLLLPAFLLLASCDKPREAGENPDSGESIVSRETKRPRTVEPEPEAGPAVDPREALKSAELIASEEEREKAISRIAWDTLETDPELSLKAFALLAPDSVERIRLIQHFAMRRAEEDPQAAMDWAETLGSDKETSAAKCQVALVLAEADPLKAANLLSESGVEGRDFDVALVQVIQRWAEKSPQDAAEWAQNFQPGEARSASIREIVTRWIEKDPAAVFSWKSGHDDPAIRQEITAALVEAAASQPGNDKPEWLDAADEETRQAVTNARP